MASETGTNVIGANEIGTGADTNEIGANVIGTNEIGTGADANVIDANVIDASEIGTSETEASEIGTGADANEIGTNEIGTSEIGTSEIGTNTIGTGETEASEMGANVIGTSEIDANDIGSPEIRPKKRIRTKSENAIIIIPTYDNYKTFLTQKFSSVQLKQICKHYKLPVTGNKQVLSNNIYKYLFQSYYAVKIQKLWKHRLVKRYAELRGPARFKRHLCVNETDFCSMDDLKDVPYTHFFSYKDSDNMIYGFELTSFYNLMFKKDGDMLNPYTRNPVSSTIQNKFVSLLHISKMFKEDIKMSLLDEELPKENIFATTVNSNNIEYRALVLFHDIDILGYYSNPIWFLSLSEHMLLVYIRELYDIWTYRAQLSENVKYEICPQGNPFVNYPAGLNILSFRQIQHYAIILMEAFVNQGINSHSRYLGSSYVLCALTLVNTEAAQALPWLFESVAPQHA